MREIKFRAWDKYDKKMIYDVTYDKESTQGVRPWVFMQFTGLTDVNGKEIYEGDIMGYDDKRRRKVRKIVKYEHRDCEEYGDFIGFEVFDDMVVIGNIYENPELLEEVDE